jgi:hypothetical protein
LAPGQETGPAVLTIDAGPAGNEASVRAANLVPDAPLPRDLYAGVLDCASQLLDQDLSALFFDPKFTGMKQIQTLHLTVLAAHKVARLTPAYLALGMKAATQLSEYDRKPPGVTDALWFQARDELRAVAKGALLYLAMKSRGGSGGPAEIRELVRSLSRDAKGRMAESLLSTPLVAYSEVEKRAAAYSLQGCGQSCAL